MAVGRVNLARHQIASLWFYRVSAKPSTIEQVFSGGDCIVVDAQSWLDQCAAHLLLLYLASLRCGDDDVLPEDAARALAADLIEDRAYSRMEPGAAAELFLRHTT